MSIREASAVLHDRLVKGPSDFPLNQVIEGLPAAVYTTDADGRILSFNQAAIELWGREPVSGKERWCGSSRVFHPDGSPMALDNSPMARALRMGRTLSGEEVIAERPDGTRVTFLAYPTPLRDESDRIIGAVNMLLDVTKEKQAEAALRQREAEFTDFVESTSIGLSWVGLDGTIFWANRAEMELLDYSAEEYIGRKISQFHADQSATEDILARLARFEPLKDYEARLRCKDGSLKDVLIDTDVYREDGRFVHTRCFTRDVTAQKQIERRLASSAAISQALSDAGSLEEAAPCVLRALSDFFDADIVELWVGEEELRCVAFHSQLSEELLADFRIVNGQISFRSGEGLPGRVWQSKEHLWLKRADLSGELESRRIPEESGLREGVGVPILFGKTCLGAITCFVRHTLVSDPTLLTMMTSIGHKVGQFIQRARREDENRYLAAVVRASTDAIVSTTVDGVITSWNESAERLFGYAEEEAVGQPISLVVPRTRLQEQRRNIDRLKRAEAIEPFESTRLTKSGSYVPVSISFSGIHGPSGELIGTASIIRDISDPKAAEAQLLARIRQLQAVSEFGMLALATHHLPTLFDLAVAQLTSGLEIEFAQILELLPDKRSLILRAGVGWKEGLTGHAIVAAGVHSQAGYTLSVNHPVIVEDLKFETRFRGSNLLLDNDITSGLSVIILGRGREPFGVLGAYTKDFRKFNDDDVHFLQSVANILATAIERRRHEERQTTLVHELSHRVKNTLAVIQSIVRQTGLQATSIEEFTRSFEGRILALAKAHDLLTESNWAGARLQALLKLVVATHLESDRLHADIEDINLNARSTQAIVLVFHELLTNAAKYGALSNDKGRIIVRGSIEEADGAMVYNLTWRESSGPSVEKPARHGFGSKLVDSTIKHQCNGKLAVDWQKSGLVVEFRLPVESISADAETRPPN